MYQQFIRTTEQAVVHLLLHCAHRDQVFLQSEYVALGKVITSLHADRHINLTEEIEAYYAYHPHIEDEYVYLSFLVRKIGSSNRLSLYWHCLQLIHTDDVLALQEETLLSKIAKLLYLTPASTHTLHMLVQQNSALQRERAF